jgi:hypothetical protein
MSKVYGFNEEGYRRVVDATRRVLKTPRVGAQRRRLWPVIGEDVGDLLVEITEADPYQLLDDGYTHRPVAFYRGEPPNNHDILATVLKSPFCSRFDRTDRLIAVRTNLVRNVHWTGSRVWVRKVGKCYQIVSDGVCLWAFAVTQQAISQGNKGYVELFEDGPIVEALSETSIDEATACKVLFDDHAQQFVIFAQACPPVPPEGT